MTMATLMVVLAVEKLIMDNVFTIQDLYAMLQAQMKMGNGHKKILLSDDDEGNGYHPMYFGVTPMSKFRKEYLELAFLHGVSVDDAKENYIIIG